MGRVAAASVLEPHFPVDARERHDVERRDEDLCRHLTARRNLFRHHEREPARVSACIGDRNGMARGRPLAGKHRGNEAGTKINRGGGGIGPCVRGPQGPP